MFFLYKKVTQKTPMYPSQKTVFGVGEWSGDTGVNTAVTPLITSLVMGG
jgi:hypothetical protein